MLGLRCKVLRALHKFVEPKFDFVNKIELLTWNDSSNKFATLRCEEVFL